MTDSWGSAPSHAVSDSSNTRYSSWYEGSDRNIKSPEDYENGMKGKLKSYLSCIPDVVSYDLDPTKDDFILLSTDGIFQSMSIN